VSVSEPAAAAASAWQRSSPVCTWAVSSAAAASARPEVAASVRREASPAAAVAVQLAGAAVQPGTGASQAGPCVAGPSGLLAPHVARPAPDGTAMLPGASPASSPPLAGTDVAAGRVGTLLGAGGAGIRQVYFLSRWAKSNHKQMAHKQKHTLRVVPSTPLAPTCHLRLLGFGPAPSRLSPSRHRGRRRWPSLGHHGYMPLG
jgi:hypothetical protein